MGVTGIAKEDELATVFTALQKSLEDGTTFKEFQESCGDIFEKRGWTGKRAWRVDNIFRTNLQTAFSVGRYKQMTRTAKARPYAMYDAVDDRRTRPTHAALDGQVFPLDHPFWDTWWPPNGFRCRCGTRSLSRREVERKGLKVQTNNPSGRLIEPVDPVTKEPLPARLLMPDRGFGHHPGKAAWGDGSPDAPGREPFPNLPGPEDYRRKKLTNVPQKDLKELDMSRLLPAGESHEFYVREFEKRYGQSKVVKDPAGQPVVLDLRTYQFHKTEGSPPSKITKRGHGEMIPLLEEVIADPYEVWLVPYKTKTGKVVLGRHYVSVWKTEDKKRIGGFAVFEVVRGKLVGSTAYIPNRRGTPYISHFESKRRGLLLYGKGQKK